MKRIWVLTLFPQYFSALKEFGVVGRYLQEEVSLECVDLRDFAWNRYGAVDDYPYGGGEGMVIRGDVLEKALKTILERGPYKRSDLQVVFLSPRGIKWNQKVCQKLATQLCEEKKDILFICGRYEGIDQRFIEEYVDQEYSLGDFILSGGEIAAMALIDSLVRLLPGALGNEQSALRESFSDGLLEHHCYTRPRTFAGREVPEVLLSGHHQKIEEFRMRESHQLTQERRPDLGDFRE